jgi:two-component system sensor histidine kinase DesK
VGPSGSRTTQRRFRTLNLTLFLPLLAAVGVYLLVRQAQSWPDAGVLALGLAAALLAFERWTAGALLRVAAPCLVVAGGTWLYGALLLDGGPQAAFHAVAIVGSLTVPQLSRHRVAAAVGLVAFVAAVGLLGLVVTAPPSSDDLLRLVVVPAGITAALTGLMFPNKGFYDVVAELEEAGERETELALMRERMRFASDLHDIQGHTLHVVKLKVALSRKLIHDDPDRVEQELREIHDLVGDTIRQTRDLAYGRRQLNFTAELANARNLLEATGIDVHVDRRDDPRAPSVDLLAQVLREVTTNILRHSRATEVRIAVSEHALEIANDGADGDVLPERRGLAVLGQRVADAGGELTVELTAGRFVTAARFPGASTGDHVTPPAEAAR